MQYVWVLEGVGFMGDSLQKNVVGVYATAQAAMDSRPGNEWRDVSYNDDGTDAGTAYKNAPYSFEHYEIRRYEVRGGE